MSKQEGFVFRIQNNKAGNQLLADIREALNKDSYSMRVRYSGKRNNPKSYDVKKEDATSYRLYIDSKREQDNINPYQYIQRGREIEKDIQATKNARIDNLVNGYDNLETSTRNHYQHLHHENETNLDKLKTSYDEVRKLRDENRILSAKLDILNAGLKHSTKYSQFIQTVNNLLR